MTILHLFKIKIETEGVYCVFLAAIKHTDMTAGPEKNSKKTVERLYNQRAWLLLLANSYVQNPEASEDIVNDSFISLLENIDRLEEPVLKSFLATTVKNKCLNWLKRSNCRKLIHENLKIKATDACNINILEADSIHSGIFGNEIQSLCRDALEKMNPMTSKIFIDRLAGLSYKEIADKYGITQRTVSYEISKALSVLKVTLKDYLPLVLLMLSGNGIYH